MDDLTIALIGGTVGAIVGSVSTAFHGWYAMLQTAKHRLAVCLFKLDHNLNHHHSENIHDVMQDPVVFELWDAGMSYASQLPPFYRTEFKKRVGYVMGLMIAFKGSDSGHSSSDRSLPTKTDAKKYIDEIMAAIGYKY
jgi:hypothetical protein